MASKAGDIFWHIGIVMDGFNAGMRKAQKGAEKLGKTFLKHSRAIGIGMTAAGVAGVMAFKSMVSSAAEFTKAMAEVNTLGIENLGALEDAVKDVSAEFGLNLTDAAKAAYQAISAGATEAETPRLLAEAAQAATAGVTDLTTAIELGTSVTNAFGLGIKNANVVFDQAFIAVKGGVTTFGELSAAVGKVAPIMSAAGLSTGEMFAAIGALTKGGISTAESVTGLKAAIAGIIKPTTEATQLAESLGIQFNAAGLESLGLGGFMDQLREKTGGNIETMSKLFGSIEALNTVLALTGNQAESFNSLLDQMGDSTGASREAFQAFVDANPAFAFEQLKATLAVLAVDIGKVLLPHLIELAETIKPVVQGITEWMRNNPIVAGTIIKIAAVVAGLMFVLGPLVILLPGIVAAFTLLGTTIGGISVPIALAVAAIVGGLIVAFFALQPILENAKIWIKENWDSIVLTFQKAKEFLGAVMITLTKIMGIAIKSIMLVLGGFGKGVGQAFSDVTDSSGKGSRSFLESLQDMLKVGTELAQSIGKAMEKLSIWLDANWDKIMNGITWVSKWIVTPLMFMLNSFASLAEGVVGFVGMIVGAISDLVAAANKLPGGMGFLMGGGVGAMAQVIGGNLMGGGTRSAPSGFTGFSGGGGGGGAGFRSSQVAGAQAVTQHININIEGALDADQIVGEIQAPLMRVMASGLKQALA